ncbi:thioredoxin family protein [Rufibacter sp. LB8]|uniref:thioredoxin family protein n=1 Tax=Rufibacter sp. LB8 TaxID=2777781 RepID=UPI00178C3A1A|nr:thioredoxin family protein [Rufibacter sp. LB8]
MAIQTSSDAELRSIIFDKERVLVKFIDENCSVCQELAPSIERLADDSRYQHITFLRMDASENPVSSKEVKLSGTPFFATYCNGTLKDCGLFSSEKEVEALVETLSTCCE